MLSVKQHLVKTREALWFGLNAYLFRFVTCNIHHHHSKGTNRLVKITKDDGHA